MIADELLDMLVCPLCKTSLEYEEDTLHCTRDACGCIYEIEDDIPIMLIEEAERPCPDCGEQREWSPEEDVLSCADCGTTYQYDREE